MLPMINTNGESGNALVMVKGVTLAPSGKTVKYLERR
jgi:hypothetical protein